MTLHKQFGELEWLVLLYWVDGDAPARGAFLPSFGAIYYLGPTFSILHLLRDMCRSVHVDLIEEGNKSPVKVIFHMVWHSPSTLGKSPFTYVCCKIICSRVVQT